MANSERRSYYSPGQDIHFKMTTREEEIELFIKANAGDSDAREFLIKNHLLFARNEAMKLAKGALPEDEVISAGNMAIMKAVDAFDHTRGFRFTTYLRHFIRGEIAALWESKYSSSGTIDPHMTGGYSGGSIEARQDRDRASPGLCDGDALNVGKRKGMTQEAGEDHPGDVLDLQSFNRLELAKAIETLTPVEQEVVLKVYIQGLSFAEVARTRVPSCSRERVRVQHSEIIAKLRRKLGRQGVAEIL